MVRAATSVPLVVSMDVLPADVPAEYAAAAVNACSAALSIGRCELSSSLPESAQPQAVALVLWQGGGYLQVTIRVSRGGAQWTARALSFSDKDSIAERWTTVGLTVATLVGEASADDVEPQPEPDAPRVPERPLQSPVGFKKPDGGAAPTRVVSPAQHEARWRATLGGLAGHGWQGGRPQFGGFFSIGLRLLGTPLLAQGVGSYAFSADATSSGRPLKTNWMFVGLGGGVSGVITALDLAGSALLEIGYRHLFVTYGDRDLSDHEFPLRLRAAAAFPARGRLAATAGALVRLPPFGAGGSQPLVLSSPGLAMEVFAGVEGRL